MNRKLLPLLACCGMCLTVATSAWGQVTGAKTVNKTNLACAATADPNGPLTICNVFLTTATPDTRVLLVEADVFQVFDGNTPARLFQAVLPFGSDTAPNSAFFFLDPLLPCDSFVTIGVKDALQPPPNGDLTTLAPCGSLDCDWDSVSFNFFGLTDGAWFLFDQTNGQGDAGDDFQVIIMQASFPQGFRMEGTARAFWTVLSTGESDSTQVTFECLGNCTPDSTCGDGVLCPEAETCDDGYADACGSCNADCTGPGTGSTCGDGELCPETESCDDGNNTLGDGCSPKCTREAPDVHFLVDQLSLATFRRNIADLAGFVSRYWDQPGNALAVDYITAKLESFGYTNVTLDPYTFEGQTRHNVYATKMGTVVPTQMYIVSAHLDSFNGADVTNAPGADDDGSGTALVLQAARVFAKTRTDISVRFILFNNEETGLDGSDAYVAGHRALQGTLAEPTWMGDIQHDMILYDHYAVPDADVEYQANNDFGGQSIDLANAVCGAMARYGTMPCEVTDDMNNTDSKSFWNDAPAISVRENRRLAEIGANSNPHYHQPTDLPGTYNLDDYEFGFNIVKMTTGAVAELVNAEPDCNMNNVGDSDDIAGGAPDTNGDGVLDECQDCNINGTLDPIEITAGTAEDCNTNGVPDDCDISSGYSDDGNANDIPDECEPCSSSMPPVAETIGPEVSTKNRFLSFTADGSGRSQAIRLTLDDLPVPYDIWNGIEMWVGLTSEVSEKGSSVDPVDGFPNFTAATLKCAPFFLDWGQRGTVHVFHEAIVPEGVYTLQTIDNSCSTAVEGNFSQPLAMTTAKWGDTVLDLSETPPLPPEGVVNVVDALGVLGAFSGVPGAIIKARADLEPNCLDLKINVSDVLSSLAGFVGLDYLFTPTAADPCDSTCPNVLP